MAHAHGGTSAKVEHARVPPHDVVFLAPSAKPVEPGVHGIGAGGIAAGTLEHGVALEERRRRGDLRGPPRVNFREAADQRMAADRAGHRVIDPVIADLAADRVELAVVALVRTGERQSLNFSLPNAAPPGGTLLDVTTDIPESVIMPEVIVPQGQNSVSVTVEGGKPGAGNLFLKGFGQGELTIPVNVTGR